ncbi:MAG TPA: hypothetical protein VES19_07430 [Candidatus Limnocylindrales bacterium]|nr:hypothetical protein [Candidatus Limnocylindrales bacterium]
MHDADVPERHAPTGPAGTPDDATEPVRAWWAARVDGGRRA